MYTILDDIKNKSLKNVYLLYGEERYLVKQYRDKLLKAYTDKTDIKSLENDMNFSRYCGTEIDKAMVSQVSSTLPFLSEKRVLLIEDSGAFDKAEGADIFSTMVKELPTTTYIIFVEQKVNKTTGLYKAVDKKGHAAEFKQMTEDRIKQWIAMKVDKEGKSITLGAVNEILRRLGTSLSDISNELEKVLCYCMDKTVIEKTDIENIVTVHLSDKIYLLTSAMGRGENNEALRLYYELLGSKVQPMAILFSVSDHFSKLLIIKELREKGFDRKRITEKIELPGNKDYKVKLYLEQIGNFSLKGLKNAMEDCADADYKIKSGLLQDKIALETIIVKYSMKEERQKN